MNRIKYIGFYNHNSSKINRTCALSAVNKMDYVISSLNEIGYGVDVISPSWLVSTEKSFFKRGEKISVENNNYIYCPSFNTKYKFPNYFSIFIAWLWLFFYLLLKTQKNEKLIVYHSLWLSIPVFYAKKIKKINLILEIEEVYSEIWKFPKLLENFEKKIIDCSESYIIASDLLNEKLSKVKDNVVLYGAYRSTKLDMIKLNNDNYIHLVYAGGIEMVRRGAFLSIDILERLPDNYFLNIVGFGDDKDIDYLRECISMSPIKNRIKFHGELKGEEFVTFLNRCHVGLNPQITGNYMDTAFPSKILTYLGAGLNVISSKVDSIHKSGVKDLIFFYDDLDDLNDFKLKKEDSDLIRRLHEEFKIQLNKLIT